MIDDSDEHGTIHQVPQDLIEIWQYDDAEKVEATMAHPSVHGEEIPLGVESDIQHLELGAKAKA